MSGGDGGGGVTGSALAHQGVSLMTALQAHARASTSRKVQAARQAAFVAPHRLTRSFFLSDSQQDDVRSVGFFFFFFFFFFLFLCSELG